MGEAMEVPGGYHTTSDNAGDLTPRVSFALRFSGFSAHDIADRAADTGMTEVTTPRDFIDGFSGLSPQCLIFSTPLLPQSTCGPCRG
jgi:hypothetical protein